VERDRLERATATPAIMAELAALRSALAAAMGATRYQRCVRTTACRTVALLIGLPLDRTHCEQAAAPCGLDDKLIVQSIYPLKSERARQKNVSQFSRRP